MTTRSMKARGKKSKPIVPAGIDIFRMVPLKGRPVFGVESEEATLERVACQILKAERKAELIMYAALGVAQRHDK